MKKTFAKALVRAAFIASCLAFCACKDISVMVDEYNGNCLHERIWGNDTGSNFKYDARLLIPEESYTFAKDKTNKIELSCVVPNEWYLKYDDGAEEDYPEDLDEYKKYLEQRMDALTDVEDPLDPTNPEYSYANAFFNRGTIKSGAHFFNTIIEVSPAKTGLNPGDYKLFVRAWMHGGDDYIDVAEVKVTE